MTKVVIEFASPQAHNRARNNKAELKERIRKQLLAMHFEDNEFSVNMAYP